MSQASKDFSNVLLKQIEEKEFNNILEKDIVRIPVTSELLVSKIVSNTASEEEEMLFYDSIKRVIYLLVKRHGYYDTSREYEDLVSELYTFLRGVLKYYDSNLAAFVTFAWKVLFTRIITHRSYYDRYRKTHFLADDNKNKCIHQYSSKYKDVSLQIDFKDCIKRLLNTMPERRNILIELFGNPYEKDYSPPISINFCKAARNLGISMQEVRSFCLVTVYPYLENKFGDIIR